jgi:hypothetical protein
MRTALLLAALAAPLQATVYTSVANGNCSTSSTWSPGGVPGDGDQVIVTGHAVTWDAGCNKIGTSATAYQTGSGTISISGNTVTGSGTSFTTQLTVGSVILWGGQAGGTRVITAIGSDTSATINVSSAASNVPWGFLTPAVYCTSGGSLTVAPGGTLTLHGSAVIACPFVSSSANVVFDSTTQNYAWYGDFSGSVAGSWVAHNTASQRPGISSTGAAGYIFGTKGATVDFDSVDFTNLGATTSQGNVFCGLPQSCAITIAPQAGTGTSIYSFNSCTFTLVGAIYQVNNSDNTSNVVFTNNRVISQSAGWPLNATPYWLRFHSNKSTTGSRTVKNNVLAVPNGNVVIGFDNAWDYDVENNIVQSVVTGNGSNGPFKTFANNLLYVRNHGPGNTLQSYLGDMGDTIQNLYYLADEGDGQQMTNHIMQPSDSPQLVGTWTLNGYIYERVSPAGALFTHIGNPPAGKTELYVYQNVVTLPNSEGTGIGGGGISMRGTTDTSDQLTHNTLLVGRTASCLGPWGCAVSTDVMGAATIGDSQCGYTGIWTGAAENIGWMKSPWSGVGNWGVAFAFSPPSTGCSGTVVDAIAAANIAGNAYYNLSQGTIYNSSHTSGTAATGWGGFNFSTKPAYGPDGVTFASDKNLGTGSNEMTQGPRFVDSTRNLATFDNYLRRIGAAVAGNYRGTWAAGTSYAVGDVVSASSADFYGGATIYYYCTQAHTSAAGNFTNGQPGSAATRSIAATATAANNSPTLTLAVSNSAIAAGMYVTGVGIAAGTTVSSVSGTTIGISPNTTGALSSTAVNFAAAPVSGYRANWQFASIADIGNALISGTTIKDSTISCGAGCTYIQALTAWVRRGFVPQNPALWCGADGKSIGAVDFCGAGKAFVAAMQ